MSFYCRHLSENRIIMKKDKDLLSYAEDTLVNISDEAAIFEFCKALTVGIDQREWETTRDLIHVQLTVDPDNISLRTIYLTILLSLTQKFNNDPLSLKDYAQPTDLTIKPPVVILAGGSDDAVKQKMQSYRQNLMQTFKDFNGTIISGGTRTGISELVGDISEHNHDKIKTIGYVPTEYCEQNDIDTNTQRYQEIVCVTRAVKNGPLVPLQYWVNIILSGIDIRDIKLIGINGGKISMFEYQIATALGAQVGIIKNSGRSADTFLSDPFWKKQSNVTVLSENDDSLHHFLNQ